jgi:hypothetical protein
MYYAREIGVLSRIDTIKRQVIMMSRQKVTVNKQDVIMNRQKIVENREDIEVIDLKSW